MQLLSFYFKLNYTKQNWNRRKKKILKKIQSSGFVGNGAENKYFYHAKNKFFEFNYKLPNK